jgi:hypothetical protein
MMENTMDPNEFRIKLEFTIDEMNQIFRFLGSQPYDVVSVLIQNLRNQIDPQLVPPEDFGGENETDYPL